MSEIEIDIFELQVLKKLEKDPNKIKSISIETYYNLLAYCETNELYELCSLLRDLESKVPTLSLIENFKN